MKSSPAFQFYAADWLADENVSMMTLEEEGAYIRALAYCWREGSIPADRKKLAALLKCASVDIIASIEPRFKVSSQNSDRLIHSRLDDEREKQIAWREKSAEAGRKSGKVRREMALFDEPTFNQSSDLDEPNANSSFSSSSSNKELPAPNKEATLNYEFVDKIYKAYPRHDDPKPAKKAIAKAIKEIKAEHDAQWLLDQTKMYASQRKAIIEKKPEDKQFTPMAATWFNQGRYDSDDLKPIKKTVYVEVDGKTWWGIGGQQNSQPN